MDQSHSFSLGTHNLHDEAGQPTRFADLLYFTEAIPHRVEELSAANKHRAGSAGAGPDVSVPYEQFSILDRARAAAARAGMRRHGYAVEVVRPQPDLIVAWRRRLFKRLGPIHYERVVDGVRRVTPNRGTAWLPLEHRASGVRVAAVWGHRINAAFPPFIRGEAAFRHRAWRDHTAHDTALVQTLHASGWLVLMGGDMNTPRNVAAFPGWPERGDHFDRLGCAAAPSTRALLGPAETLSAKGSDHLRLRVEVTFRVR